MFSGINLIYDYLIDERDKETRDNTLWRVSDAGRCLRMRYLKRKGQEALQVPTVNDLLNFSVGDVYHEWVQDIFEKKGVLVSKEEELKNEALGVVGHYDMLVSVDGVNIIYEIKTVNTNSYLNILRENKPQDHHKLQCAMYMYLKGKDIPIDHGRILYVPKGKGKGENGELSCLEFKVPTYVMAKALNEIKTLNAYWKANKLPPCTCAKSWEKNYCIYLNKEEKECCQSNLITKGE